MSTYIAKSGDGIYFTEGSNGHETFGVVKDINATDGVFAYVRTGRGKPDRRPFVKHGSYRRETLREYRQRPTGFGKTPWVLFYTIQAGLLGIVLASILGGGIAAPLIGIPFAGLLEWVLFYMTKRNYERKTV